MDVNAAVSVNAVFQRNGLGIFNESRFAFDDPGIVRIHYLFGAFFSAGAAGNTQGFVDKTRLSNQVDLKVTRCAFDVFNFTEGSEFNIEMPADLDQFR